MTGAYETLQQRPPRPKSDVITQWEFPRRDLDFLEMLGEGSFAQVWKANAAGLGAKRGRLVAVKCLAGKCQCLFR